MANIKNVNGVNLPVDDNNSNSMLLALRLNSCKHMIPKIDQTAVDKLVEENTELSLILQKTTLKGNFLEVESPSHEEIIEYYGKHDLYQAAIDIKQKDI